MGLILMVGMLLLSVSAEGTVYDLSTGSITLTSEQTYDEQNQLTINSGEGSTSYAVLVSSGTHYITMDNVTALAPVGSAPIDIASGATLYLTLVGDNTLTGATGYAGISVPEGATLVITAESAGATLNTKGGYYAAGIGGGLSQGNSGAITILGGDITAFTSGNVVKNSASAIGGGYSGGNGPIYIEDSTITATGTLYSGGIGGGEGADCDDITIKNSTVTASTGSSGAGIGSGYEGSISGTISIEGSTVTVTGGGNGVSSGAGIGGGRDSSGGTIVIVDSVVTAVQVSMSRGAAIGGGYEGEGGSITIIGSQVTASSSYGASIGGGSGGAGGTIYLEDSDVTASSSYGTGIGGGGAGGDVTIVGGYTTATGVIGIGGGSATQDAGSFQTGDDDSLILYTTSIGDRTNLEEWRGVLYVGTEVFAMCDQRIHEMPTDIADYDSLYVGGGATLTVDDTYIFGEGYAYKTVTVEETATINIPQGGALAIVGYLDQNGTLTGDGILYLQGVYQGTGENGIENFTYHGNAVVSNYEFTEEGGSQTFVIQGSGLTSENEILVSSGTHYLTLNDVILSVPSSKPAICIQSGATVYLTLQGDNQLSVGGWYAALEVEDGATLIITQESTGALLATGGMFSAGIGGSYQKTRSSGTIIIHGGEVTAVAGDLYAAGIGSTHSGTTGDIVITGGTITAFSDAYDERTGAAIGSGYYSTSGNIEISGGTVTAYGGVGGAGIGGGYNSTAVSITISGGTVTASSCGTDARESAAGIGGGGCGSCDTILISGGTITATGGTGGAGIGGGTGYLGDTNGQLITIQDAIVYASAYAGAAIGGGYMADSDTVIIDNSYVEAICSYYGAGIGGGGSAGDNGTVIIRNGSTVVASSDSGAGIGGGGGYYPSTGGVIEIYDSTVTASSGTTCSGIGGGTNGTVTSITIIDSLVNATSGTSVGIGGAKGVITLSGGITVAEGTVGIGSATGDTTVVTNEQDTTLVYTVGDISDTESREEWDMIHFEQDEGTVYGSQIITEGFKVQATQILTVPSNASLTFADNVLTLGGSIYVESEGELVLNRYIDDGGSITLEDGGSVGGNRYDLNGDDVVNQSDITCISVYYGHPLSDDTAMYDLTDDGEINCSDYLAVYSVMVGEEV